MGPASTNDARTRCAWAVPGKPLVIRYHDHEWGVPARDDRKHFEFLVLEGAQTGLNWLVILNKREGYRRAFSDFDPEKVARYSDKRVAKLLQNPDIIRNRMKIESALATRERFSRFKKSSEHFGPMLGSLSVATQNKTGGKTSATFPRPRRYQTRSARISRGGDFRLLVPRWFMPTCKQPAWSMTTRSIASDTRKFCEMTRWPPDWSLRRPARRTKARRPSRTRYQWTASHAEPAARSLF